MSMFLQSRKAIFSIKNVAKHVFSSIWPKKVKIRKFQIFHQNTGLTPLAKCKFCNFFILMFLKERLFLWQECRHKNWPKNVKVKKFHIFCPKPRTNVLNRCFYSLERLRLVFQNVTKHFFFPILVKKDRKHKLSSGGGGGKNVTSVGCDWMISIHVAYFVSLQ